MMSTVYTAVTLAIQYRMQYECSQFASTHWLNIDEIVTGSSRGSRMVVDYRRIMLCDRSSKRRTGTSYTV